MESESADREDKPMEVEDVQAENEQQEDQDVMEALEELEEKAQEENMQGQVMGERNQIPQKPKKPLTPYMLFIQRQKEQTIPGEKFNLKIASQVWKTLTTAERAQFHDMYTLQKEAYDEYIKKCVEQGINIEEEQQLDFVFPNARIRAIMRQDPTIAAKGQTVIAMNKAVEFFGEHLLASVSKTLGGKKKVEASDLWEAINSDKMLWFLRPLIDQKESSKVQPPRSSNKPKPTPNHIALEMEHQPRQPVDRPRPPAQKNQRTKQASQYQTKLTDMFRKQ